MHSCLQSMVMVPSFLIAAFAVAAAPASRIFFVQNIDRHIVNTFGKHVNNFLFIKGSIASNLH